MISINLILLISTIVCLICCCVFTSLSIWSYFKGKSKDDPSDDSDSDSDSNDDDDDISSKHKTSKDNSNNKNTKVTKAANDDDDDDDLEEDKPKKRSGTRWYIIMAIVTFVFTIGLGIAYWFTRESLSETTEVQKPPSPEEVAREEARRAMLKISRDYDTLESEMTSESNDGLNAVRIIEKYSRNTK